MKLFLLLTVLFSVLTMYGQVNMETADAKIAEGKFIEATALINAELARPGLKETERYSLNFRLDLMKRILIDFRRTEDEISTYLKKYYPLLTPEMLRAWESDGSLEMRMINGERRYFANAGPNLFRINKEAKPVKEKADGTTPDPLDTFLNDCIPGMLKEATNLKSVSDPIKIKLNYTVTLKPDVIPAGETVRCWLPYPKEGYARQTNVKLLSVNNSHFIIAPDSFPQRTVYMEKITEAGKPLVFNIVLEYNASAQFGAAAPGNDADPKQWLGERPPHILFTPEIKKKADELTAGAATDFDKAKKIFDWIDDNIPWASALEYSTIGNISGYCLTRMHGDCGIKTLLFMTMCRYAGIPARWQSGWMLHPGSVNLHDWCTIYINGIGWIPVDQSFGKQMAYDDTHKYFFFGNTDPYHLIVNDDYGRELYPAKIYPRSETVDFQRGELEWRGGNIYFNDWNYSMKVEYLSVSEN